MVERASSNLNNGVKKSRKSLDNLVKRIKKIMGSVKDLAKRVADSKAWKALWDMVKKALWDFISDEDNINKALDAVYEHLENALETKGAEGFKLDALFDAAADIKEA